MLGRLSQQLSEKMGSAAKTEPDADLQQQMEQADFAIKTVTDVLEGFSKVVQPDAVSRVRHSFKPTGRYENMFTALTSNGAKLRGVPYFAADVVVAGNAMQESGVQESELAEYFEQNTLPVLKKMKSEGFAQEYGSLKKKLEKRRLEMDRMKNNTKVKEGDVANATKNYEGASQRMLENLGEVPTFQANLHALITDFCEKLQEHHENVGKAIQAATTQMRSNVNVK